MAKAKKQVKKVDTKKLKKLGMKPKTIADLRKQQKVQRAKRAVGEISKEKMKALEEKQAKKALAEISKEQEKLGTERQKRLGMAEELRNLYPELSDNEFNLLLKSQFGLSVPVSERAGVSAVVSESAGGRRTKKEIEDFKKDIQSVKLSELMEDIASNPKGLTTAQIRDIQKEIKDRKLQLKAKAEAAADEPALKRAEEEKKAKLAEIAKKAEEEQAKLEQLRQQEESAKTVRAREKIEKERQEAEARAEELAAEKLRVEGIQQTREESIQQRQDLINRISEIRDHVRESQDIIKQNKLKKEYKQWEGKEAPQNPTRAYRRYLELKQEEKDREEDINSAKEAERQYLDILGVKSLITKKGARKARPQTPESEEEEIQLVPPPQIQAPSLDTPPQTVVQQNDPDQNIDETQAQVDAGAPVKAGDGTGAGLNRKYAIHPHHIKEGKNKYILSSKAKKHVKNLNKLFPAKKVESIINFSLLNKARNDRQGLTAKFKAGKAVKGYRKEKVSGGNIYYKL
jgi:hypothetical protein